MDKSTHETMVSEEDQENKITEMIAKQFSFVFTGKQSYFCQLCGKGKRFSINAIYPGGINMRMINHYNAFHDRR